MNTTHNRRKLVTAALGAVITAAAAPALLFLGTGTAHAVQPQEVSWDPWLPGVGLTAHVRDTTGSASDCFYTATPAFWWDPLNLPTYQHQFHLPAGQTVTWPISNYDLPLPALATGTVWNVSVDCGPNGQSNFVKQF